ncbi:thiamine phosphate synthase [Gracilibacillus sp. JCM 18860]|uniref:thiamine phosphate synthase n=1 Tax=Gracilibacillus sp. JCM 18860 TaxID=1306159 RepID=UPI0006D29501
MKPSILQVYFILGTNNTEQDPLEVLEEALQGGVSLFQFREKGKGALIGEEKKQMALKMRGLCHQYDVPFLINDDIDLALEIGADGVHIGQEDEPFVQVKSRCPDHWIIGVSATNEKEAIKAKEDGADYIGVGPPIYGTNTKEDAKQPIGENGLRNIREQVGDLPIVAIGGIKLGHIFGLRKAGADGVSIITAISRSKKPKEMAHLFRKFAHYQSN